MTKFLSFMGAVFIMLLIVGGALFGYATYTSKNLDKESKTFVDSVLPKIIAGWDIAVFDQYADQAAMKDANISKEQMVEIFGWSKNKLGGMTSYQGSQGQSFVQYFNGSKVTAAQYTASANFEHGEAKILITLSRNAPDGWKIAGFNVNSPAFMNAPTPYR